MSHHSELEMIVLHQDNFYSYFGAELTDILFPNMPVSKRPSKTKTEVPCYRMRGYTRSDWFKWETANLLKLAPFNSLQFLTEQACTHLVLKDSSDNIISEEYLDSLDENDDERDSFYMCQYTIIAPYQASLLADETDEFTNWIAANFTQDSILKEYEHEDIRGDMRNAISCILSGADQYGSINSIACADEEGDDPLFLFSTLKTISELFRIAKAHELYSIYINTNGGVGYEYFKKFRPANIVFY